MVLTVEIVLQFLGLIVFVIGGILFLVEAFKTSLLWGFGCVFLTPVTIFYLVFHWATAKKPFAIQMVGLLVLLAGTYLPVIK